MSKRPKERLATNRVPGNNPLASSNEALAELKEEGFLGQRDFLFIFAAFIFCCRTYSSHWGKLVQHIASPIRSSYNSSTGQEQCGDWRFLGDTVWCQDATIVLQ